MKRRDLERKEANIIIIFIMIIGTIIGAFLGGMAVVNDNVNVFIKIGFCISTAIEGSFAMLFITYFVISAIVEIQTAIREKKYN